MKVMFLGKDIGISPATGFKVLPGLFNFNLSPIKEHNVKSSYLSNQNAFKQPRCYVMDLCSIEVTLTDSFGNLVDDELGVLKYEYINIIRFGPLENIDGFIANQTYFQNVS